MIGHAFINLLSIVEWPVLVLSLGWCIEPDLNIFHVIYKILKKYIFCVLNRSLLLNIFSLGFVI